MDCDSAYRIVSEGKIGAHTRIRNIHTLKVRHNKGMHLRVCPIWFSKHNAPVDVP